MTSQSWPAGTGLHPQQRVADGPALCALREVSAGDGEHPLAADLTGGEVQISLFWVPNFSQAMSPTCVQMFAPSLPSSLAPFGPKVPLC